MMQTDKNISQDQFGTLADKQRTADLKTSEMIALWTIRTWVWASTGRSPSAQSFDAGLEEAGCPDVSNAFATFLEIVGTTASEKVAVHAPTCPTISDDEKRLLHALAALQCGHTLEAFDVLTHLLPGAAVRIALSHAESAAMGLARAGLLLPDRTWKLEELSLAHQLRAPRAGLTCVRYMIH